MKKPVSQEFKVIDILYPKIDFNLEPRTGELDLKQAFRGDVVIKDSRKVAVRFGVALFENKKEENNNNASPVKAIVEAIGLIEFKKALGKIKNVNEIPLIANILALLYPFLREKINYCFSNNKIPMLLPPLNVIDLLHNAGDSFKVTDTRKTISTRKKLKKD